MTSSTGAYIQCWTEGGLLLTDVEDAETIEEDNWCYTQNIDSKMQRGRCNYKIDLAIHLHYTMLSATAGYSFQIRQINIHISSPNSKSIVI